MCTYASLEPTPVSWLVTGQSVGWSHFQISTDLVSMDRHRASVDHGTLYIFRKLWLVERRLDSSSSLHETVKPGDFWASHWYDGGNRIEKIWAPVKILKGQDAFLSYHDACARKTAEEVEEKAKVVRKNNGKITGIRWMASWRWSHNSIKLCSVAREESWKEGRKTLGGGRAEGGQRHLYWTLSD